MLKSFVLRLRLATASHADAPAIRHALFDAQRRVRNENRRILRNGNRR